jgi:hypothetical protein
MEIDERDEIEIISQAEIRRLNELLDTSKAT